MLKKAYLDGRSTSELSVEEYSRYLDNVMMWATAQGLTVPDAPER